MALHRSMCFRLFYVFVFPYIMCFRLFYVFVFAYHCIVDRLYDKKKISDSDSDIRMYVYILVDCRCIMYL